MIDKARGIIEDIVREVEIGEEFEGTITRLKIMAHSSKSSETRKVYSMFLAIITLM